MMLPRDAAAPAGEVRGEASDQMPTDPLQDNPLADIAAERACAGALLLALPELSRPVLERLHDDDLADVRCRFVVTTVRRMLAEQVTPDTVTFASFVERHGLLEPGPARTHLRSWLSELANAAPAVASLGWYADAVIQRAARLRMVQAGREYQRAAAAGDIDVLGEVARTEYLAVADALDRTKSTTRAGAVSADV